MRTYEQIRERHDLPSDWSVEFAGAPDEARRVAVQRRETGVSAEVYPLFPEDCSGNDGELAADGGTTGSLWETRVVFSPREEAR
jgi:hypothetical protein